MNHLLPALKTFRPLNLLFIALTMVLTRHFLVLPVLQDMFRIGSSLDDTGFVLLVIATVLIAAAGYLVNDHLDRHIDKINRPGKEVLPGMSARSIEMLYIGLNVVGVTAGTIAAMYAGNYKLAWIFVGVSGMLYLYSNRLKRIPVLGNVVVSVLVALTVLIVGIFETGLFNNDMVTAEARNYVWFALGCYALFAFLINMVREIVKDTEDMQGDKMHGRRTLPIEAGEKTAKFAVIILLLVTIRVLLAIQQQHLVDGTWIFAAYIALLVQVPAVAAMVMTYRADRVRHYTRISLLIKLVMLAGILSMPLYESLTL